MEREIISKIIESTFFLWLRFREKKVKKLKKIMSFQLFRKGYQNKMGGGEILKGNLFTLFVLHVNSKWNIYFLSQGTLPFSSSPFSLLVLVSDTRARNIPFTHITSKRSGIRAILSKIPPLYSPIPTAFLQTLLNIRN